jgi:hypothetical protein
MTRPGQPNRIGCAEFRSLLRQNRRGFLKSGFLASAGFGLSDLLRLESSARAAGKPTSRDKSVIILWMRGGPSQHETWDPKPDAPEEYRGSFGAMSTSVPGIQICDLLPMSAKIQHKYSIIRSLHHTDAGHSAGDQICFTGYLPNAGQPDINVYPSCGSIVSKQLGHLNPKMPPYVIIPRDLPGSGAAYLGQKHAAFATQADPAKDGPFSVPNFELSDGLSFDRLTDRRSLIGGIDRIRREADVSGQMEALDSFQQQAWDIVTGAAARDAFNLDAEPSKIRERYGFMPEYKAPTPDRCGVPAWSQRILLARRLVEYGVRLVTVDVRWWDTHVKGYETMRDGFLPRWDRAYTALIEDLEARGMLDTTMVIAWGEFGRTPKVNGTGGRDHWPNVFSAALAGGGIKGGRVVGSSDAKGAEPKDNPKHPSDVLATMYRHLGVDTTVNYEDHQGRPHPVLPRGTPIDELTA